MAGTDFNINRPDPLHHVESLTNLNNSVERRKEKKEDRRKKRQHEDALKKRFVDNTLEDQLELIESEETTDDDGNEHIDFKA